MTKKERTQEEILQAAKSLIYSSGYESITVRNLAEVTGYSYTNLYYYFKDLKELLWKLRSYMIEEMIIELSNQIEEHKDPTDELVLVLMTYINYYYNHYNTFRFFYFYPFVKPENDTSYAMLSGRFTTMWDKVFKRLLDEGLISFDSLEIIVNTLLYSIHGMILLNFSHKNPLALETIQKQLKDIVSTILQVNNTRKDIQQ